MSTALPIYREIAKALKEKIEAGIYLENDPIPSEPELAKLYQVSRMTARQAINELVYEGILYRVKGKGTYVNSKKYEKSIHGLTSFSEDMIQKGFVPSSKLTGKNVIKASEFIAKQLQIKSGDDVIELKRIRLADEEPMAFEIVYLPVAIIKSIPDHIGSISLYDYIEKDLGLLIDYSIQEIEAVSVNEEVSEALHVLQTSPCLFITLQSYLKSGQIFEYVESYYRADRYKFIQPAYRRN
ncbi:MAG: GntR family transcriptional regulator [Turicibacter sp.]